MSDNMKICIIGGRGKMGRMFESFFINKGHDISIIGRKNYDKLNEMIINSNIIIVSVPLNVAPKIIDDVAKYVNKNHLVIDFSSAMSGNRHSMENLNCESAFVHPLFGPEVDSFNNQNFIVCNIQKGDKLEKVLEMFSEDGANISYTNVNEHDKMMSIIQGLSHLNLFLFGKTLAEQNIASDKLMNFETTLFSMTKDIASRYYLQEPHVGKNIAFINPYFVDILNKHIDDANILLQIIKQKDGDRFEKSFNNTADKIKRLCKCTRDINKNSRINIAHNQKLDKEAIVLLGPAGSNTDIGFMKSMLCNEKKVFLNSITEVIDAVKNGKAKAGFIPMENSIHGTVVETLDKINESNLYIIHEIDMPIHHSICALEDHGKIETIISHPQAIQQCLKYIRKHYPKCKIINALSTSAALKMVQDKNMKNTVAIGPVDTAQSLGLKVIDKNIEDEKSNKTRFVFVADKENKKNWDDFFKKGKKTSLLITPSNEKQGILFNMLKFFDKGNINLTKIESRPLRDELGKYMFNIDIDGNIDEQRVDKALSNIKEHIGNVKVLGCYDVEEIMV